MFVDKTKVLCTELALGNIGTVYSDVAPMGEGKDANKPLKVKAWISTPITSGGSTTIAVNLQTDDVSTMDSALVTHPLLVATAYDTLNAKEGHVLYEGYLPRGMKKFARLSFVVAGANTTAGKVSAIMVVDTQTNRRG